MAGSRGNRRLKSDFTLGAEQAEADKLLQPAFYETGDYTAITSKLDSDCFLVARTGAGKSALLQRLEETHGEHVLRINPEDLSLPYIADLGVVRHLHGLGVHLDPLFIALWKHVLLVEIIRHRYKLDSVGAKQNWMATLRDRISRDPSKIAALEYLDEFEGKFWCETDERVKAITQKFEEQIQGEANGQLAIPAVGSVGAKSGGSSTKSTEIRQEQAERYQRVVNETQLPRLNKMMSVLDEDILDSAQNFTYIVIDDLDRDWVDEEVANDLVRCLFRTVLDLKRVRNLKILVALRTNIFEQLDFGSTGAQEEKFRALIKPIRWTRADIESMLDERVRVSSELRELEFTSLRALLPQANKTRGDPVRYILDRTLMRPRDAIGYLNECIQLASGKPRLSWDEIHKAESAYSHKRLLALRDEWKGSFSDIDRLFRLFRNALLPLSRDELSTYLDDAMLLSGDPTFRGVTWMTELSREMLSGSGNQDWCDLYQPLLELLFNVGFLGIRMGTQSDFVYSFADPGYARQASNLDPESQFFVHPAFHSALDVGSLVSAPRDW